MTVSAGFKGGRPRADTDAMTITQIRILRIVRVLLATGHGADDMDTGDAVLLLASVAAARTENAYSA